VRRSDRCERCGDMILISRGGADEEPAAAKMRKNAYHVTFLDRQLRITFGKESGKTSADVRKNIWFEIVVENSNQIGSFRGLVR
jgi:hypothetical protein